MANKLYEESNIQAIANAIRTKKEEPSSVKYTVADMAQGVLDIPSGGEKPTVTDGRYLFAGNRKDLIGKVAVDTDILMGMFYQNRQVTEQDILTALQDADSTIGDTNNFASMFYGCTNIENFDTANLPILNPGSSSNNVSFPNAFQGCTNLKTASVNPPEGSIVLYAYNLGYMFYGCTSLESVSLRRFRVLPPYGSSASANFMFSNCTSLTDIQLSVDANTFSPTTVRSMFAGCSALTNFESDQFYSGITDSYAMFQDCTNLQKVKLSKFSVASSGSVSMSNMFQGCTNLKTVDMLWNNGNNSSIVNSNMFNGCSKLENIVIRTTGGVCKLSASNAFTGVPADCKIYVPDALVNSYKIATNWSARAAYIFPLSEYVES